MADRIDVHHHVYPPFYSAAIERNGGDPSGWYLPPWTLQADKEICARFDISTAILSCTEPGPGCEPDPVAAQKLARACNEYVAEIVRAHPKRYGFFACLPSLLDTQACLEEIAYALDVLEADGIVLMTRYGEGHTYLGHKDFTPIWDALNERSAVVFIHPTAAADSSLIEKYLPQPVWDFPHETGRTAIDLILTNMLRDHACNCKIILSHAGGTLPYLIDRPAGLTPGMPAEMNPGKSGNEILEDARRFYFDTALSSSVPVLGLLKAFLGQEKFESQVLYGSDFPNAPEQGIAYFTKQLTENAVVDAMVLREAGLKLFPRLRG